MDFFLTYLDNQQSEIINNVQETIKHKEVKKIYPFDNLKGGRNIELFNRLRRMATLKQT
jgi:hypothetical protein